MTRARRGERRWFSRSGDTWHYCVFMGPGWKMIATVDEWPVRPNGQFRYARENNNRILACGGTVEGLKKFVERVSQNWEV